MKKRFLIELDSYPDSQKDVCAAVENYSASHGIALQFENKKKPILFSLDGSLYAYEMVMANGKYCLRCVEI